MTQPFTRTFPNGMSIAQVAAILGSLPELGACTYDSETSEGTVKLAEASIIGRLYPVYSGKRIRLVAAVAEGYGVVRFNNEITTALKGHQCSR